MIYIECSKCTAVLPESAFSPDKRTATGLQAQCKACRNAAMKAYRLANPERSKEIQRDCYLRNAEAFKERARAYDLRHRTERRAKHAEWQRSNAEYLRAYHRTYRLRFPERVRAKERNYDHRKRANTPASDVTADLWAARVAEFGGRCAYCLTPGQVEMEHIDPVSRGGSHTMDNLVPACRSCNASKHDDTLLVFLLRRKALVG